MTKLILTNKNRQIRKQAGVTMIEYALIAALVAVAAVVVLGSVGDEINIVFNNVLTKLKGQ